MASNGNTQQGLYSLGNGGYPSVSSPAVDLTTGAFAGAWQQFFAGLVSGPSGIQTITGTSPMTINVNQSGQYVFFGGSITGIAFTRGKVSIPIPASTPVLSASKGDVLTVTFTGSPAINFIPGP